MRKEEFVNKLIEKIPGSQVVTVNKNNTIMTGINVKGEGNISPTIYIDQCYEDLISGEITFSEAVKKISDMIDSVGVPDVDVDSLLSWDDVKEKIMPRIVSSNNNPVLVEKPYRLIEDLAVIYAVDIASRSDGNMSAPVTNNLSKSWGVTEEDLFRQATKNLNGTEVFQSMREVLMEMMGVMADEMVPEEGPDMFVLSNKNKLNGACELINASAMKQISEKLGGDFIILPSSVHEVIILPITEETDLNILSNMVVEVNETQVDPIDRLSDNVYRYDSEKECIELAVA